MEVQAIFPENGPALKLARGRDDIDVMEAVQVQEIMMRNPVTIPASLPVTRLPEDRVVGDIATRPLTPGSRVPRRPSAITGGGAAQ